MTSEEHPGYPFGTFLDQHAPQLNASAVPPELWHSLYKKLTEQKFDAGDYFQIIAELNEEGQKSFSVLALDDMHNVEENNVFLIDHLFSFSADSTRSALEENPQLVDRIAALFGVERETTDADESVEKIVTSDEKEKKEFEERLSNSGDIGNLPRHESVDARLSSYSIDDPNTEMVDKVMKEIWKHSQTYSVGYSTETGAVETKSVWYIMDEFGARIRHSSTPNIRIVPLMFLPQKCAYNVMFLTKPVSGEEEITRDCAENVLTSKNPDWRKYLELPWMPSDFTKESIIPPLPTEEYFSSGRIPDTLASDAAQETCSSAISTSLPVLRKRKLKLFADDTQLTEHLTSEVEMVDNMMAADVIWMIKHFHDYEELAETNPCGMINQFPYESCITVKDLLASCAMRDPKKNDWYQLTYNLNTQLPQFVACFQQRQQKGEKNVWIVKPWNLARGMEMCVTDDLNKIIRLIETGPKIVCEYIARPLLFPRPDNGNRVKFDLRYIVFVNSIRPLTAYVYNNFWIRFAINEFTMSNFEDQETHFTVFNYLDKSKVLQMKCEEFIKRIETTYPTIKWDEVQDNINSTIRKAIEAAAKENAPCGVAPNVQSRAMYGVDIMLQHADNDNIKPTLLEINFMPDTTRACQYYTDFADTVFNTMFLDDINPTQVTPI